MYHPLGVLSQLLACLFTFFLFFSFIFGALIVVKKAYEVFIFVFFVVAVLVFESLQNSKLPRQFDKKLSQFIQINQTIP